MLRSLLGEIESQSVASAVAGLVVLVVALYFTRKTDSSETGEPPYVKSTLPLLSNTLNFMRNAPRLHDWFADVLVPRDGQPVLLRLVGRPDMLLTARPEHFEEVLKTQFHNFPKSTYVHEVFFDIGGDNITTTNGETWRRQRQIFLRLLSARALREHMTPLSQKHAAVLCDVLGATTDEQPIKLSMVRDLAVAAVVTSRDTTADVLSWLLHVLGQNPRVKKKLRGELLAKLPRLASGDSYMPSIEEISTVTYVEATNREVLRLYPPGPFITVQCARDVVLADRTFVAQETDMVPAFYTTGQLTSAWAQDAASFVPERFLGLQTSELLTVPPTHLCAISTGPRSCVGQSLAMTEMKIVLAIVVDRFRFEPDAQQNEVVGAEALTLGMKHPLLMRVERVVASSASGVE